MAKTNISTKQAVAEIKRLVKELNTLREETKRIAQVNKASFDRLEANNKRLTSSYVALNAKVASLHKVIDKNNAALKQAATNTNKAAASNKNLTKSTTKAGSATKSLTVGITKLFAAFGLVAGVQLFANLIKEAFTLTLKFDSLRFAMATITDSMWGMAQSQQFLLELNKKYGADLVVTTERWIRFLAAAKQSNMTLLATEKIFESVTKASATLGLGTDELKSVYLALEQMLSKGKVTTEELRRQLGERLPGAMGIMAASMGKTIPELDKMLKRGEVLSAEVLPGFADALEVAYGIEAVEKVNTLRATIDRLSGAWQIFVTNISEGESTISKVITRITEGFQTVLDRLIYFTGDDVQKFRIDILDFREDWEAKMTRDATKALEILQGVADVESGIREEMRLNRLAADNTTDREELLRLNQQHDDMVASLINYGKLVGGEKRAIAEKGFLELKKEKEDEEKVYADAAAEIIKWEEIKANSWNGFDRARAGDEAERLKAENEERYINLLNLTAEYDIKKKILEVGAPAFINDDDDGGLTRRKKSLEEIRDLEKEIQIAILKSSITTNEKVLAEETTGWEKRIFLNKQQQEYKNRIAQLDLEIEIEQIRAAEKKKLEVLNKPATKNQIPFSKKEVTDQTSAINTEADQLIIIAKEELYDKLIKNGQEAADDILKTSKGLADDQLEIVQDGYNLQIIAAKENYENSAKTAKDKIILDEELKRIGVEAANAQIDAQIKLLEAKLIVLGVDEEVRDSILRQINDLKALKKNLVPPDTEKEWQDLFLEIMEYAADFNKALGDIVNNIYESRIENINAEIEAEKDKYDKLLLLAKNDEKEKEALTRNRDLKMAQLEKKRLKEEQKQAIARKAFAIADIAINTAVAISKVLGQTGVFGIPLVPVVAAIGALQIAAVLAAPIPKYKEGRGKGKKETAMINDGIYQEYIERNGEVLTTDRKNAIVNLESNDIVHKNYDSLTKNSDVISGVTGGSYVSETDFNRLFGNFTSSMVGELRKVKISNNINVSNNSDSYRDKMSRWNG